MRIKSTDSGGLNGGENASRFRVLRRPGHTHKRGRPVEASVFVFSLSKSAERVSCDVPLEQPRRNIVNIGPKSREIPTERREANIKILVGREVPMED